jgi:uncharacterized protein (DUF1778 family)
MSMPRSDILHIRLTPEERERLRRAAEAEYLDVSTWARRAILQALDGLEARREPPRGRS